MESDIISVALFFSKRSKPLPEFFVILYIELDSTVGATT